MSCIVLAEPGEENVWVLPVKQIGSLPDGPKATSMVSIPSKDYSGFRTEVVAADLKTEFVDFLLARMSENPLTDETLMVDLMDELLGMDLPLLVLKIVDFSQKFGLETIFAVLNWRPWSHVLWWACQNTVMPEVMPSGLF